MEPYNRRGNDIKISKKKVRLMMDARIGNIVIEAKRLPETLSCDLCGSRMNYVSEELGYSCTGDCILNLEVLNVDKGDVYQEAEQENLLLLETSRS